MSNTLCSVLKSTLSLLSQKLCEGVSESNTPQENCRKLATALNEYESNVSENLRHAFTFLGTAVGDLAICYENLEGTDEPGPNGDQNSIFYTADGSKLERELSAIKSAEPKFSRAQENFQKCNMESIKICQNESLILKERITATKVRVITDILGNLDNLVVVVDKCMKTISELQKFKEIQSLFSVKLQATTRTVNKLSYFQSKETKNITSVININETVFNFIKKFIKKPVAIFNWPVIKDEENPQTFHPIIGQPMSIAVQTNANGLKTDARISAINCKAEILMCANRNETSCEIVKIVDGMTSPFWSLTEEKARELNIPKNMQISSICVDCINGCLGSNHINCKNNVYVLAKCNSKVEQQSVFVLFLIDDQGNLLHKAELSMFPRRKISKDDTTTGEIWGKIFCTKDKVVVFDLYKLKAYLCDGRGELEKPLNVREQKLVAPMASITSDEDEIIVLKAPRKIVFYNIKDDKFLNDREFEATYKVKALAFNHASNEVNLLCCKSAGLYSREYHLMRYEKSGELKQDIKLPEDSYDFKTACLVSHPSGLVVLLDNHRLLYLQ